jgi:xylan 1,4-beta-xylosidase
MGVYRETSDGMPLYNFLYVDQLFDYILSIGMRPFVEFGFMPSVLARSPETIFWWKGHVAPPRSWERWEELVYETVSHFKQRYGEAEVARWFFEVWNEPNLPQFFAGSQQDYFTLYAHAARAVKRASTSFRVGGPATAEHAWVPDLIAYCASNGLPIDFVSTHGYGVEERNDSKGARQLWLYKDCTRLAASMNEVATQVAASSMPNLEVHYTEWSSSYSSRDPIHDHYYSAAYILNVVRATGDGINSLSYWTFSDIFEELGPPPSLFHGGFGLVNIHGLPKPAFFAFWALNRLGATQVESSYPQSWVCCDERGVQVLLWDVSDPPRAAANQDLFLTDFPESPQEPTEITLRGVRPGKYVVSEMRVDREHLNIRGSYFAQGAPTHPSVREIAALQDLVAQPLKEVGTVTVDQDGVLHLSSNLARWGVLYVECSLQAQNKSRKSR